ncbi:MAG: hypothetical protein HY208_09675 [Nitrospirae bacterium]|nr:hypothetical protein [Nitrospirota bacterium]
MEELFGDKRINEALELLNEVAKDKRVELSKVIAVRYGNLKSMLESMGEHIRQESAEAYHRGKDKVVGAAKEVDESVHKHPWVYIAGTAMTTLFLGYLFGRSNK